MKRKAPKAIRLTKKFSDGNYGYVKCFGSCKTCGSGMCEARDLIDKLAAYEDIGTIEDFARLEEAERWVPVSERMPNKGKYDDWHTHVLALAGERVLEAYVNQWGTWSRANAANMHDLPPVTHWKPLPEAPKEESHEND